MQYNKYDDQFSNTIYIVTELKEKYSIQAEYLAFDFTKVGEEKTNFYNNLNEKCNYNSTFHQHLLLP